MGDKTGIEWTESTWTPIRARNKVTGKVGWHCTHASPGCVFCYAEAMNKRLGTGLPFKPGHEKDIELFLDEEMLTQPLRWKRPRMIFVCSMTDLFADFVPDAWIDKVFAVMAMSPQHVFQCLTKRSGRMRAYCSDSGVTHRIAKAMDAILVDQAFYRDPVERWAPIPEWENYEASTHGNVRRDGNPLKQQINPLYNRAQVTLWQDNEPKTFLVHLLVLRAHHGAAPKEHETRHRNGNESDNRLANIEWSSRSVNQQDKVRHGSNGGPAKLTREQAAEIKVKRLGGRTQQSIADEYGVSRSLISMIESGGVWPDAYAWPLSNVWLGISAEDQARADERVPDLLATPAAVRWVSYEPALGPVDFTWLAEPDEEKDGVIDALLGCNWIDGEGRGMSYRPYRAGHADRCMTREVRSVGNKLDWIVAGGESGPGARPVPRSLFQNARDQCAPAGVAFFHKQNGEWIDADEWLAMLIRQGGKVAVDGREITAPLNYEDAAGLAGIGVHRYQHQSDGSTLIRVGKKAAGRRLDGVEHNGMPR